MNSATHMRGSLAVELAVMMPLLVTLVFGITEAGRILYQINTLTKSVAVGARFMARTYQGIDPVTCATTANWAASLPSAVNLVVFNTATPVSEPPVIPGLSASDVSITVITDRAACVVRVSVTSDFVGLFSGSVLPFFNTGTIPMSATTEERYIGT